MSKSAVLMDGHVHLYPEYDLKQAFRYGTENIQKCLRNSRLASAENIITVWLLTERWDCNFFQQMVTAPKKFSDGEVKLSPASEKTAVMLERKGFPKTFIFAGRQLVSKDGLEILALATDYFVKDRTLATSELIAAVNQSGGVPVLNWAPGKWFFNRGKIVRKLLDTSQPKDFVVGDNPLRPVCWPMPGLMKYASQKHFKVIAGSDPLPFAGEEKNIGTYCFATAAEFDENRPVSSVRKLLKASDLPTSILGKRNGVVKFAIRETRIMLKK
jgi:hypothetical protein